MEDGTVFRDGLMLGVLSYSFPHVTFKGGGGGSNLMSQWRYFGKIILETPPKSSKIVYFITCRRCGLQYVGETSHPLRARINGNRSDITHWNTDMSRVAEHFNSGAHSVSDMMSFMVIELSTSGDPCLWKVKEGRWIRALETSFPSGMNLRVDSLWNLTFSSSIQLWVSFPSQLFATSPSPED